MSDEPMNPLARMLSIEAGEVASGLAEGRAVADAFLQKLRSGDVDADALHQLMKSEAMNAFAGYRFKGICSHLQEVLRST